MPIGIGADHDALADALARFAARETPVERTRTRFEELGRGERPDHWDQLVGMGIPSLHIDEEYGGAGAGLLELAVALEQSGHGLIPGPLLATVTASAVIQGHGTDAARKALLPRFAAGATGACGFEPGTVTLEGDGDEVVASGTTVPVLGAVGADVLVLAGQCGEKPVWFVVPSDAEGVTCSAEEGVDLTRDIGRIHLSEARIPADHILGALPAEVGALAAVLQCAEAVGIARWAQETSLAYAKIREQFGRPIGSFQAIKHKCAQLFIRLEVMTSAVWDAATAADGDDPQQAALAAARAATVCRREAVDVVLDCLTLLGGIGNTWEHDIHLYWRRAVSLLALGGSQDEWARRAGELALTTERHAALGVEDRPEFRARVAATIAEAAHLDPQAARVLLADRGLVSPHYPEPYGVGADTAGQLIIAEEFERAGMPQPTTVIGEWALPSILQYGTEDQMERLVAPTLRGEIVWCQLFSEPGAGSDLASLTTFATKVDGGWRIDGSKVWNSKAHEAHWGICLARTDREAPKHRGISFFLVDMSAPGVEVRPLREANGDSMFNEVILDGVFVPDADLVGAPGEGWKVARTTLANERVAMGTTPVAGAHRFDPVEVARTLDPHRQQDALPALGRITSTTGALDALAHRSVLKRLSGLNPGVEASALKAASARHITDATAQVLEWFGPEAAIGSLGPDVSRGGRAAKAYLSTPSLLIGGGTLEIQLNVISEQILGLPREPRTS
ncbi:acyl-CoA dehydrogenase [Prescottella agglutinans]|uniref:Alkylation response protein AidB-like acyl-CoA dehydrogenase n=1 Tax=Prescottella agglutinans TaxID=1644129 RepID=A0ABT6MBF0_9NOCA|nr:acyl-CoA dehydrogenase [Prescottella agglutinans]MDH6281640.1 alkylation response protein AidB-like acyl-CoA dehydrogenase [Prescottella agglutinans]